MHRNSNSGRARSRSSSQRGSSAYGYGNGGYGYGNSGGGSYGNSRGSSYGNGGYGNSRGGSRFSTSNMYADDDYYEDDRPSLTHRIVDKLSHLHKKPASKGAAIKCMNLEYDDAVAANEYVRLEDGKLFKEGNNP